MHRSRDVLNFRTLCVCWHIARISRDRMLFSLLPAISYLACVSALQFAFIFTNLFIFLFILLGKRSIIFLEILKKVIYHFLVNTQKGQLFSWRI